MPRATFKTGIDALDALLGGQGVPTRSVILIAGEPGAGKTTLAWDILAACTSDDRVIKKVMILSCDESGQSLYENYVESYGDEILLNKYGKKRGLVVKGLPDDSVVENQESAVGKPKFPMYERLTADSNRPDDVVKAVRNCITNEFGILVIDGVNTLIDVLTEGDASDAAVRAILRSLRNSFKELNDGGVVILTCERREDRAGRLFESYLADVVIELRRETVTPDRRLPGFTESILVCQVTKGRGIRIQRRRICYDFARKPTPTAQGDAGRASGTTASNCGGIRFYQTYPADGSLSLFSENAPQRAFIETFKAIDIPTLYPNLSLREFDLSNMYQEYAIRRRGRDIPARRPLMVMNVDEYWVDVLGANGIIEPLERAEIHVYGSTHDPKNPHDPASGFLDAIDARVVGSARSDAGVRIHAVPHFANVSLFAYRKSLVGPLLKVPDDYANMTLEEVERVCLEIKKLGLVEYPLRLEMKHVDTFSSTLIELVRAHGGDMRFGHVAPFLPNYLRFLGNSARLDKAGIAAFARFRKWIHEWRIVRPFGTIDPTHPSNACTGRPTWAVARHWYTSLVNTLFRDRATPEPLVDPVRVGDIRVTRIPKATADGDDCFTWGEWYLAVENGAENMPLAYKIIDNLLAQSKVVTHALTGAGLPVCAQFYREYENVLCIGTNLTYGQIRTEFFAHRTMGQRASAANGSTAATGAVAIRRSEIAEYRHVMRRLNAAGLTLLQKKDAEPDAVWKHFRESLQDDPIEMGSDGVSHESSQ